MLKSRVLYIFYIFKRAKKLRRAISKMSTNGIINLNKAEIAKLALAQKRGKTAATQQPEHMTKNGSIFKAPETKQTENPKSASELKSLDTKNLKTKSQCEQALKDIETASQQNPIIAAVLKGKAKEITQNTTGINVIIPEYRPNGDLFVCPF